MKKHKIYAIILAAVLTCLTGCGKQTDSIPGTTDQTVSTTAPTDGTPTVETTLGSVDGTEPTEKEKDDSAPTTPAVTDSSNPSTEATEPAETEPPQTTTPQPEATVPTAKPEPAPEPTEPTQPTQPSAPTEPAPTEPMPTEPAPTEPEPTEPTPTEPEPDTFTEADHQRIIAEVKAYAESYSAKGFTFQWKESMTFGWDVGYMGTPRVEYEGVDGVIERLKYHVDLIYKTSTDSACGLTTTVMTYKVEQITVDGDLAYVVIYGG